MQSAVRFFVFLFLLLGISSPSHAYTIPTSPGPDWDLNTLISNYTADGRGALYLTPLDDNLMGESHDIDTGAISFRQVDVALPGNSHLKVEFARRANARYYLPGGGSHTSPVGRYWDVDIPYIVTRVDQGNSANCNEPSSFANYIARETLDIGTKLHIPGRGERDLGSPTYQTPAGFYGTREMATRDLWIATCADTANANGVVGYVVKAPNGDTYKFDHVKIRSTTFTIQRDPYQLPLDNIYIMPTEITDVNGNWVKYEYNAHGVTRIWSSDGREITMGYSGELITTVMANGRQWTYSYNDEKLKRIDLPDTRYWSFGLNEEGMKYNGTNSDDCRLKRLGIGDRTLVMKHPSGTVGSFHTDMVVNYVKNIPNKPYTSPVGPGGGEHTACSWGTLSPKVFSVRGLISKTLTLPTGENYVWSYDYHQPAGNWITACYQYAGGPTGGACMRPTKYFFAPTESLSSTAPGPSLPDEKIRSVIDPLGHKTDYHLNVDWYKENANLSYINGDRIKVSDVVKKEYFATATSTTPLETTTYHTFDMFSPIGGSAIYQKTIGNAAHIFLPTLKTIERDGDIFTYEYDYNMDPTTSDFAFKRPIQTKVSSNVSTTPRITDTIIYNDRPNWILGLTKSVTQNGRLLATNNYTNLGQFKDQVRYGVTTGEVRYNTDGTIDEVEDAIGRITKLSDWKRGKPETIKKAFGTTGEITFGQTIDDNGWVTANTDAKGQTTTYIHDTMGRLTSINPAGSYFIGTTIGYDFSGGGAVQTITKGAFVETVTYDSMYRKTLEQTQSTSTGWEYYVNTTYDALGRVTFQSQPSASATETQGTTTTYDGLGRILTQTETASGAQTVHSYHNSHRHTVRDPAYKFTHYYSYGYDGPGNADYQSIYEASGGRITEIIKNIWGETELVRQRGAGGNAVDSKNQSQFFYYDAQRRLCRYRELEGNSTLYDYNDAGEMVAYQKGAANGTTCDTPSGTAKVSMTYDDLGRLELTDFADTATPDIFRTYDDNGNILTLNRNGVDWTYEYNELDLLEKETLSIDGLTFPVDHIYNNRGHIAWKKHPTNSTVAYAPDGLGRATQAKWGTTVLADNITYHPSGSVYQMDYGNGQDFTQTLNTRLLPDRLLATGGGVTALDLSYTYDQRAKITSIIDGAVSGNNRSYTYDALGQMKTATGPWGTQTNDYDTFGNILSRVFTGATNRTIDLQYDNKNRVYNSVDSQAVGTGFGNSGTGSRTVGYDSRGNVTTLGTIAFAYDYSDQPTVLTGSLGGTTFNSSSYTYDGNLKRVKSVVDGRVIYNVYDSTGALIHVRKMAYGQAGEERSDYVRAAGKSIARLVRNGTSATHTAYFTFSDHLGSPVATMNGTTGVLETERYTPFGIAMDNPNALSDQAGFTGHIKDSATGLNYMQARYYDPVMGRFLSIDPVTFIDTGNQTYFNRYAYCANDPVACIDPTGMAGIFDFFTKFFDWGGDAAVDRAHDAMESAGEAGAMPSDGGSMTNGPGTGVTVVGNYTIATAETAANVGANIGIAAIGATSPADEIVAGTRIALGVADNLDEFATAIGASTHKAWASGTGGDMLKFWQKFDDVTSNSNNSIHFNLDGFDVTRAGRDMSLGQAGTTTKEYFRVTQNPDLLNRTTFYKNGRAVNP